MSEAVSEAIQQAQVYKEQGNQLFAQAEYRKALGAYHKVFLYLKGLADAPPPGTGRQLPAPPNMIPEERMLEVKKLKASTKLNMGACYLKTGDLQKCVEACTEAIGLHSSAKGYFRRGQAHQELRNFAAAKADLQRAHELDPENPAIDIELRKVRNSSLKGDDKEKKWCAKMFAQAPPDPRVVVQVQPAAAAGAGGSCGSTGGPRVEEVVDAPMEEVVQTHQEARCCAECGAGALGKFCSECGAKIPQAGCATGTTAHGSSSASSTDACCWGAQEASAGAAGVLTGAGGGGEAATRGAAPAEPAAAPADVAIVVQPMNTEAVDQARKPDFVLRELRYSWDQDADNVKVYVHFDDMPADELQSGAVDESRVQVEFGDWSALLIINSLVEGRRPMGIRLDLFRRVRSQECRCTVRSKRITLKLVKVASKDYWVHIDRAVPLHG